MFPKYQLWIKWLHLIRKFTTCLVLVYITNLILYSNQNHMNFTIGTLVYSVEMIPGWLVISLECTDICSWEKQFFPQCLLSNSTLCHWSKSSQKYYNIFKIINLGRRSMFYWNYFSLLFGFLVLQKVKNQERKRFSNITEWQRSP